MHTGKAKYLHKMRMKFMTFSKLLDPLNTDNVTFLGEFSHGLLHQLMQDLYTTKQPREAKRQADHLSDVLASHENSLNTPKLKAKAAEIQFYLEMGRYMQCSLPQATEINSSKALKE